MQNTSSAVMQQRSEPHDSLDDFPTQPWATRALIKHVIFPNMDVFAPEVELRKSSVWEPACNRGHMAKPLREFFGSVRTGDIHDYECGQEFISDFLFAGSDCFLGPKKIDWIITNPPFRLASQFFKRAVAIGPRDGIAMIVRTSFLEGVGRYNEIFKQSPPSIVAQFTERVPMVRGRLTAKGSTATSYCWLVWMMGEQGTRLVWIPPCRKQLERPEDYLDAIN